MTNNELKDKVTLFLILATSFASILGLAWKTGSATEGIKRDVKTLQEEQSSHIEYERAHGFIDNRLTRIETMIEMSLKASGIKPPPKRE